MPGGGLVFRHASPNLGAASRWTPARPTDGMGDDIARAQLTKSGHVCVLSNIGSFGDPFDVHAIIYSEDAPALENKIHKAFADCRVNIVNMRKE